MFKKGKFSWKPASIIASLLLFMYFGLFANSVLAYEPKMLYDEVWKLVNTKYLDSEQNHQNWQKWRHKYDGVIKTEEDAYVAVETMLASLNDPYTRFLDPEAFADETQSIKGTLYGIGIQIGIRDDKLVVIAPIEETPAQKAGILANDEIIKINGESTKGISVKDAADKIRGPEGTTVQLVIKRENQEKTFTVSREKINVKSVSTKVPKAVNLDGNIGYIRLNSFLSSNASSEILNALKLMKDKNGYIIDLRSNPGGLLSNAISISNMFIDDGVIVSTVDRDGYKETQNARFGAVTHKPLVILIDEGSASASEIFSGAMKDHGRAVLVGTKSFGKGLVQEINRLPGGSGMNLTIQKYLTPNGTDINKVGIVPDYEVKNTEEDAKNNKDPQLEKAQEVMKGLIAQSDKNTPRTISKPLRIILH